MNVTAGTTTVHATGLSRTDGSYFTLCGAETRHTRYGLYAKRLRETMHPVTCKTCAKRMHTTD